MSKRTPKQMVELADRLIEHGFKHGMYFSEAKHKQIRRTVYALFSKAADAQYGRGVFGAPHGAANESKYGYMILESVDKQRRRIQVSDYYDWAIQWQDRNTLHDPYEDIEIDWQEYVELVNAYDPGENGAAGWCCPAVRDLLVKLRPAV